MNVMQVVAAVLVDADGRILLDQRPAGKALAGRWEFPGGKLEPGETSIGALYRELREELAVEARAIDTRPLIDVPWQYETLKLRMVAYRVRKWQGTPQACEGQALAWLAPQAVDLATLAPADRYILWALRLPAHYPVTPDLAPTTEPASVAALLRGAVTRGERLLQLRLPTWSMRAVRELAAVCLPWLRQAGASLLLNGDIEGARRLGTGVHLRAAQLATLSVRPLPPGQWVGASCHDVEQLHRAQAIGADFAVVSPVQSTPTHPEVAPLGWAHFSELVAQTPLPVYAMGGMSPMDIDRARTAGAQGVAGIRAFWPGSHLP